MQNGTPNNIKVRRNSARKIEKIDIYFVNRSKRKMRRNWHAKSKHFSHWVRRKMRKTKRRHLQNHRHHHLQKRLNL